jgi:uncharacterized protein YndB with AHSA1/START domain
MSDESVSTATGRTWSDWFKLLDTAGAKKMTHQEITGQLSEKHGVPPWWTQMVAVTYEQARGLRDKHEKPQGFEVSISRTIETSIAKAFKAWTDEKIRSQWLSAKLEIRKATANKSLRITWEDGKTSLAVAFLAKAKDKTQVVAQHSKLPNAKAAAKMKTFWAEALERMKTFLE